MLWDEIIWVPNRGTKLLLDALQDENAKCSLREILNPINLVDFGELELTSENINSLFFSENARDRLNRVEAYLNLSNTLHINYFPHPERATYMMEKNMFEKRFNRHKIMEGMDKDIANYYHELTSDSRYNLLRFTYPLLYDYIRKGAVSPLDELSVALELRHRKDVVEFRKTLIVYEEALQKGNRPIIVAVQKQLNELSESISNLHSKEKMETRTMQLGITLPIIGGGVNVPIIKKMKEKAKPLNEKEAVLNLTFLTELRDFGIGKFD